MQDWINRPLVEDALEGLCVFARDWYEAMAGDSGGERDNWFRRAREMDELAKRFEKNRKMRINIVDL